MNHWQAFVNSLGKDADEATGAKRKQVEVSFQEDMACTDGKSVVMPADISSKVQGEAMAIAAHERYGHGGFTNFNTYQKVCKEKPWLQPVLNALEDIRVDKKVMDKYGQYTHFYKDLLKYIEKGHKKKGTDLTQMDPKMKVLLEMIHRSYPDAAKPSENSFTSDQATLDWIEKNKDWVDDMISKAHDPKSTTEKMVKAATEVFRKVWGEEPQKPPPEDGDGDGDNKGDGNDQGDGGGSGSGQDMLDALDKLDKAKENAKAKEKAKNEAQQKYEDSGGGAGASETFNAAVDELTKAEDKEREAEKEVAEKAGSGFSLDGFTPSFDVLEKDDLKAPEPELDTIASLKECMIDKITSQRQHETGRINSRRLPYVLTSPESVRQTDMMEEVMPQRWIIFGDCSGSMKGVPARMAGDCLGMLAKAAEEINLEVCEDVVSSRIIAFDHNATVVKEFDDNGEVDADKVSKKFEQRAFHGGGTDLERAFSQQLDDMDMEAGKRDMIIVFTDGDIGDHKMVSKRKDDGRIWVLIGIGTASIKCDRHTKADSDCYTCEQNVIDNEIFDHWVDDASLLEDTIVKAIKSAVSID